MAHLAKLGFFFCRSLIRGVPWSISINLRIAGVALNVLPIFLNLSLKKKGPGAAEVGPERWEESLLPFVLRATWRRRRSKR